mmetsp:Transcript_28772/g.31958  ORF Transcript_28772/g.31958 Transcript_28772/m.31958 type:complete len:287 (+) Transcript_28772:28-888(+)
MYKMAIGLILAFLSTYSCQRPPSFISVSPNIMSSDSPVITSPIELDRRNPDFFNVTFTGLTPLTGTPISRALMVALDGSLLVLFQGEEAIVKTESDMEICRGDNGMERTQPYKGGNFVSENKFFILQTGALRQFMEYTLDPSSPDCISDPVPSCTVSPTVTEFVVDSEFIYLLVKDIGPAEIHKFPIATLISGAPCEFTASASSLLSGNLVSSTGFVQILDDDRLIISDGAATFSQVDKESGVVSAYATSSVAPFIYYPGFTPLPTCVSRKRAIHSDEERIQLLRR